LGVIQHSVIWMLAERTLHRGRILQQVELGGMALSLPALLVTVKANI